MLEVEPTGQHGRTAIGLAETATKLSLASLQKHASWLHHRQAACTTCSIAAVGPVLETRAFAQIQLKSSQQDAVDTVKKHFSVGIIVIITL